jgi:hypothetical protein
VTGRSVFSVCCEQASFFVIAFLKQLDANLSSSISARLSLPPFL